MSGYDITSRFSLIDNMTPALNAIVTSLDSVMNNMEMINASSKNVMDITSLRAGRQAVEGLKDVLGTIDEETLKNKTTQDKHNRSIKEGSDQGSELLSKVKGIAATYISMQGVKMAIGLSDELTLTTARLDQINDGLQSTEELNQMIYKSAMRGRGAYSQTADIVSKLGLQAGHAFGNNQEIIAFTEQLQKRFKIAGTDAQGIESVMYNLTQAMSAGVLRGQDLNAVLANAPSIAQDTAKYMGYTVEEVKELAEAGELTARNVIEAMLSTAEQTNEAFESIPLTFGDMWTMAINHIQMSLKPVIEKMNEIINTESFQKGASAIVEALTWIAGVLVSVLASAIEIAAFISDNWSVIEPIVIGISVAFGAWLLATNRQAIATGILTTANTILNSTLLASPIYWLIAAIAGLIVVSYKWIQSVGGIQIAWLITKSVFWNVVNAIEIAAQKMSISVTRSWNNVEMGTARLVVNVKNWFTDMKASVIKTSADMVNSVIKSINWLIDKVNKIPGVSIDAIATVGWGAEAAIEAETIKQARKATLDARQKGYDAQVEKMQKTLTAMEVEASSNRLDRENEIVRMKAKQERDAAKATEENIFDPEKYLEKYLGELGLNEPFGGSAPTSLGDIAKGTDATAKNTEVMAKELSRTTDDLSALREILTARAITNVTSKEVKVEQTNNFGDINNIDDLDGFTNHLVETISEEFQVGIGGVV